MGLFSRHPDPRETYEVTRSAGNGGEELPGVAGYKGTEPLPKNAMPVIRFKYVRPDGKPD